MAYFPMANWVLGYVTGVNFLASETDMLATVDTKGVQAWVDNYCQAHPLDTVDMAAQTLTFELLHRAAGTTMRSSGQKVSDEGDWDAVHANMRQLIDSKR
jgi:hypothetical protein